MIKPLAPIAQKSPTNLRQDIDDDSKSDSAILQASSLASGGHRGKEQQLFEKHSKLVLGQESRKKSPTAAIRAKKLFPQDNESSSMDQMAQNGQFYPSLANNELTEISDKPSGQGLSLSSTWPKMHSNEEVNEDINRVNSVDQDVGRQDNHDSSPLPMKPTLARSAQRRKKQLKKIHYDNNSQDSIKSSSKSATGKESHADKSKSSDVS